jgi:hypothetical protein
MHWLLILLFPLALLAQDHSIVDIDFGNGSEEILVLHRSGKLSRVSPTDTDRIQKLQARRLELPLYPQPFEQVKSFASSFSLQTDYVPSVLNSFDEVRSLFFEMRPSPVPHSECWQRAHIWAYEWRVKHQLFTSKAWIFFTRKYMRQNPDLTWWFHVAPLVHVKLDGVIKERVLDRKYTNGPISIKKWTDTFMRNRENCRVVDTYSDHANYQDSASCFIQKSSMYYLQPVDLELLEKFNTLREKWVEAEIRSAYAEAFDLKTESSGSAE